MADERKDRAGDPAAPSESGAPTDETRRPTWLKDAAPPERESSTEAAPEPPNDLEGPEEEPPHVQCGSPHPNEPAPYDEPNPETP